MFRALEAGVLYRWAGGVWNGTSSLPQHQPFASRRQSRAGQARHPPAKLGQMQQQGYIAYQDLLDKAKCIEMQGQATPSPLGGGAQLGEAAAGGGTYKVWYRICVSHILSLSTKAFPKNFLK